LKSLQDRKRASEAIRIAFGYADFCNGSPLHIIQPEWDTVLLNELSLASVFF
jgi:hypothetical protein